MTGNIFKQEYVLVRILQASKYSATSVGKKRGGVPRLSSMSLILYAISDDRHYQISEYRSR